MPQYRVYVAQFPGNEAMTHPDPPEWVMDTVIKMRDDPLIGKGNIYTRNFPGTPITMLRNLAVEEAKRFGADYLLMVDSDIGPDKPGIAEKPFWDTSWAFLRAHEGPAIVAAPYGGPPPNECPYVFRWRGFESSSIEPCFALEMYSREEAAAMTGVTRVSALATGLILIDMKVFTGFRHPLFGRVEMAYPYFDYEWKGDGPKCESCGQPKPGPRAEKASTEDVFFTRDAAMMGVPLYCNWDSWAVHWKRKAVGKPREVTIDMIGDHYLKSILGNRSLNERLVEIGVDRAQAVEYLKAKAIEREHGVKVNGSNSGRQMVAVPVSKIQERLRERWPAAEGGSHDKDI